MQLSYRSGATGAARQHVLLFGVAILSSLGLVTEAQADELVVATGDTVAGKTLNVPVHPTINDFGEIAFDSSFDEDGVAGRDVFIIAPDGSEAALIGGGPVAGKTLQLTAGVLDPTLNNFGDVVFQGTFTEAGEIRFGIFLTNIASNLLERLMLVADTLDVSSGIQSSLQAKLNSVFEALQAGNDDQRQDAIEKLEAFINAVEAQRGNKISDEDAELLVDLANAVIDSITIPT